MIASSGVAVSPHGELLGFDSNGFSLCGKTKRLVDSAAKRPQ
jgi:hypothetical protein